MAKKKVKSKKSKPIKRRTHTMAKKKKPTTRRKTTGVRKAMSAHHTPKKRRKKKSVLSDGMSGKGFVEGLKATGGGSLGGGVFLLSHLLKMNPWLRVGGGITLAVITGMFKPTKNMGAGLAGVSTYEAGKLLLQKMNIPLADDMEDTKYVDADTLSDTDLEDDDGNPIVVSEEGTAYALQDNGELMELGDANHFYLQDDDDDELDDDDDDMQSVSMIHLQDDYSLADANPYALANY